MGKNHNGTSCQTSLCQLNSTRLSPNEADKVRTRKYMISSIPNGET